MSSHWTSFSHTKLSLPRVLKFHLRSVSVLLELVGGQYNYFCILLNFSILIVLLGVESTNLSKQHAVLVGSFRPPRQGFEYRSSCILLSEADP